MLVLVKSCPRFKNLRDGLGRTSHLKLADARMSKLAGGDEYTESQEIGSARCLARNLEVGTMKKTITSPYDVAG